MSGYLAPITSCHRSAKLSCAEPVHIFVPIAALTRLRSRKSLERRQSEACECANDNDHQGRRAPNGEQHEADQCDPKITRRDD
jgi:hypothetical protein